MSLPHALLTELVERPRSGSELAARFDKSIGFFWHASHQQIYRELARLEEAGCIESLPEEPTRGRKRAYRLLPAGMERLRTWMTEPTAPMPLRDELMLRLWSSATVGSDGLAQEVHRRLQAHEAKLALYRSFEARDYPDGPDSRKAALQHLVLQAGIRYERNWVEMLQEALAILQQPYPAGCDSAAPTAERSAPPPGAAPARPADSAAP
ncbi:MAG: PadR family transcriptional regulator [Burkholderiaceae bacterium]